jgi:RNA polymerase sigma factor (sigma-70 family)
LTRVYGSWLRRAPTIDNREAYVRRAILNEYLRRRRLRSASELVTDDVPDVGVAAVDVAAREDLWQALGTLPPRQRAVLVLRYYEDLPDREIAVLIGAKEATVRSLAARALAALRTSRLAEEST